ncbi:MAG: wax ester/triacylglycerol synthase family O-acyltransferase [Halioglobus sp.]|nr:wax ester/triacylglycerol synthase family O-acyltransferase [Halioglobus sp.]
MKTTLLKPVDATWLFLETADTPMHVGVLAIFYKPRNAAPDYLRKMAARMREFKVCSEPWNMRLSGEGLTGMVPRMVEARDVELSYHFQHSALPEPGGERELGVMVSRLHSPALDRNRPLWEFHLIEGLERDRFAFYVKIHHALVSFLDSVPTILSMLADSARQRNMPPLWAQPLPGAALDDPEESSGALASLASLGRAGAGLLRASVSPNKARGFLLPRGVPRSTLNRAINQQRRFATQQFEQTRIERIAAATSSTVNEVLTYLCATSLRRFFKEYNALPDESLVGLIPVSLRERGSQNAANALAGIRVELGTNIGDPLARLAAVKKSIKVVRDDRNSLPEEAVTPYVLLRAAPMFASQLPAVGRFVPPVFNLKISNVQGTDSPMYFDGARLDAIYPISQLLQYGALSIDCVSYAGTLNIGFTGARDTLPHLQRLAVYVGRALDDLEQLVQSAEDAA